MPEYIEHEAINKYYVVRDKNTGLYFRGKGVNKWGKYYNQASIYRIKAHAENTVEEETRRGAQPEVVEIRIVEASTDMVEVVHGEWKETMQPLGFEEVKCATCSVCNDDWIMDEDMCIDDYKTLWKYCPVCGAKMDGERRCEE